ncbi:hypothetical protein [Nonomuraea salmonea]|uniref:carbohydrate kinase family protein n=1 Tax=Nonomuraea salmonea TaxID=46181 RepID=UPI002FEBDEAF
MPGANLTVAYADLDVAVLRRARAVHLGGMDVTFGLGDPAFFALLDELRAAGTIVTMDLLSEMPDLLGMARAFLPHVDYVLPNESQALLMTGEPDVTSAARALLADGPPWRARHAGGGGQSRRHGGRRGAGAGAQDGGGRHDRVR